MSRRVPLDHAGYDVIGDVHGQFGKLQGLLTELGYHLTTFGHPHQRQAIFVGDLIDIGPGQREVLDTVRAMVERGRARLLMGNHEFNALCYATPDPNRPGDYLRPHAGSWGPKNREQHQAFLAAVGEDSADHRSYIEWFKTLPLWLELDGLRIVHACWDAAAIAVVGRRLAADGGVSDRFLADASREGTRLFRAVETILKGPDLTLPRGFAYRDAYGIERDRARQRWWDRRASTLRSACVIPPEARSPDGSPLPQLPDTRLTGRAAKPYAGRVPVIFGHYWRTDDDEDTDTTVCVDRSAGSTGPLAAYRWNLGDCFLTSVQMVYFPQQPRAPGSRRRPSRCPSCQRNGVVPIEYGLMYGPPDMFRWPALTGGCIIEPDSPKRGCVNCGWVDDRPRPDPFGELAHRVSG